MATSKRLKLQLRRRLVSAGDARKNLAATSNRQPQPMQRPNPVAATTNEQTTLSAEGLNAASYIERLGGYLVGSAGAINTRQFSRRNQ